MRVDVIMPKMGMTMTSGVVSQWLKEDGDVVELDEAIADIETDKIANQVQAPAAGTLHTVVELFDDVPVAEVIAYIETAD